MSAFKKHDNFHEWSKLGASEALCAAINYIRDAHGEQILANNPTMLADLTAAYSRIYAAHVIADALRDNSH